MLSLIHIYKRTNKNGERPIELCKATNLIMISTTFKHLLRKQKTWISPNPNLCEFQVNHVAISRKSSTEFKCHSNKKQMCIRDRLIIQCWFNFSLHTLLEIFEFLFKFIKYFSNDFTPL